VKGFNNYGKEMQTAKCFSDIIRVNSLLAIEKNVFPYRPLKNPIPLTAIYSKFCASTALLSVPSISVSFSELRPVSFLVYLPLLPLPHAMAPKKIKSI
jgi:hypothetical protein